MKKKDFAPCPECGASEWISFYEDDIVRGEWSMLQGVVPFADRRNEYLCGARQRGAAEFDVCGNCGLVVS